MLEVILKPQVCQQNLWDSKNLNISEHMVCLNMGYTRQFALLILNHFKIMEIVDASHWCNPIFWDFRLVYCSIEMAIDGTTNYQNHGFPRNIVDQNGECSRTSRFYQTESNSTCRKFDKTNLKKQQTSLNIIDLASSQVVQGFQIYVQVLFQGASHQTAPASTVLSWNWMMGLALAEWGVTSWVNGGESVCNEYIYIVIVYIYMIFGWWFQPLWKY